MSKSGVEHRAGMVEWKAGGRRQIGAGSPRPDYLAENGGVVIEWGNDARKGERCWVRRQQPVPFVIVCSPYCSLTDYKNEV